MRKYLIIAVLASIGIFNAFYLSIPAYQYWNGADKEILQSMPCDLSESLSCSGILQNPRAIIFSIGDFRVAFPMIAAVVYPVLFLIALMGILCYHRDTIPWQKWLTPLTKILIKNPKTPAKVLTAMAAGGMLFNSYVIYQEFVVWVFCPLCAICTVIIVTIFFLSICIWKTKKENWNTEPTK